MTVVVMVVVVEDGRSGGAHKEKEKKKVNALVAWKTSGWRWWWNGKEKNPGDGAGG